MVHAYPGEIPVVPKKAKVVFVIEDDALQLQLMTDYLQRKYKVEAHGFSNGEDALQKLDLRPDMIVLDYHLDQGGQNASNGVEILKKFKTAAPLTQVVMLSSQDKITVSVDCMKNGAYDYIVKGENAFQRLENIFGNIDTLMDHVYFRRFYKDLVTFLSVLIIGLAGIITLAMAKGWIIIQLAGS